MDILILLIILIFSAIVHEVMHGVVAEQFGDDTARLEGRITLNPIPHIDPIGSIALPALLLLVHSPIVFGAAKPVPVNFNNLQPRRLGMALVSLAGPLSNYALAIILGVVLKLGVMPGAAQTILTQAIIINLVLGTFNLIPIPPLDGSKVIGAFLPYNIMYWILSLERYGFFLIIIFLYLGLLQPIITPVIAVYSKIFGLY